MLCLETEEVQIRVTWSNGYTVPQVPPRLIRILGSSTTAFFLKLVYAPQITIESVPYIFETFGEHVHCKETKKLVFMIGKEAMHNLSTTRAARRF